MGVPCCRGAVTREGVCGLGPLQIAGWPFALPSSGPHKEEQAVILAEQYYPRFMSRKAEAKGLFSCDSFRMAQEPLADAEIRCFAEPWSCVVSPGPAKLVGLHNVPTRDAFLVRDVLLAHICCLFGQHARCSFMAEEVMGMLQILGSNPALLKAQGQRKKPHFWGCEPG